MNCTSKKFYKATLTINFCTPRFCTGENVTEYRRKRETYQINPH